MIMQDDRCNGADCPLIQLWAAACCSEESKGGGGCRVRATRQPRRRGGEEERRAKESVITKVPSCAFVDAVDDNFSPKVVHRREGDPGGRTRQKKGLLPEIGGCAGLLLV